MKWGKWIIILIPLLALSAIYIGFVLHQYTGGTSGTVTDISNIVSDATPASGKGEAPPGVKGDGPWNHRLLIAVSSDGVTWYKTYRVLADQALAPDVIVDREGYVRVYYVDYYNRGIVVAISRDLVNWKYVKVKGVPPDWTDPSIVILHDGRYRLYASYMPPEGGGSRIVSAVSDDGIHFKVEEGVRYERDVVVRNPEVIYAGGKWVMYLEELTKPEPKILLLTSEDGLNFVLKGEIDVPGGVPCLIKYDSGYRLYIHSRSFDYILMYSSHSLENWGNQVRVLWPGEKGSLDEYGVAEPAVAKLPDGSYVMIYKTWIEKPAEEFKRKEETAVEPEKPAEEFKSLLTSILGAEKISEGCYLLRYPGFSFYMLWKPCDKAEGKYSFRYKDITFLFDDKKIEEILKAETKDPKNIDKLRSRLEKLGNYIMLLVSDDGVKWENTGIVVARDASVPDIMVDKEGRLRVYYVSFPFNKIRVAISEDAYTWEDHEVKGIDPGWVDPEVLLVDGKYVLYSLCGNLGIAFSDDGIHFTQHSCSPPPVMDPTVFRINGKWYMVAGPGTILYTSEDGIHFKKLKEINLGGEVCDSLKLDDRVMLYCHYFPKDKKEGSYILLFESRDGENWEKLGIVYRSEDRFVADPSVTFFNGKYYMVVTAVSRG